MKQRSKRPIIWIAICFAGGNAAAANLDMRGLIYCAAALMLFFIAWIYWRHCTASLAVACLMLFLLAAGQRYWIDYNNSTVLAEQYAALEQSDEIQTVPIQLKGVVTAAALADGDRIALQVDSHWIKADTESGGFAKEEKERFMVHIKLKQEEEQQYASQLQRGVIVELAGQLSLPQTAGNRGGFDYKSYLKGKRIHWLLKMDGIEQINIIARPQTLQFKLLHIVDQTRAKLGTQMDKLFNGEQAGYMKGLVLGIREDLDPAQFKQFSALGLTHILAISGLHVAVFMYMVSTALKLLRWTREKIIVALMLLLPVYILLSGASPSVIRAGLMALLGLAAARMGKLKDGLHLIAAAALLMLAHDPYYINDVSFQLSFIVTIGLIIGVPALRAVLPDWKKGKMLLDLFSVTLVAQLISFPLTIYYFNQFNVLSIAANFIFVPFISSIILPLGTISLICSYIYLPLGSLISSLASYGNDWSFFAIQYLASSLNLSLIWPSPPVWWIVCWYGLCLVLFRSFIHFAGLKRSRRRGSSAVPILRTKKYVIQLTAASILLVFSLWAAYTMPRWEKSAVISFLDVGQGDAILIKTPAGRHILLDGGGLISFRKEGERWKDRKEPFEIGEKVVLPLLMKRGVQKLDAVIISHLDSDHIRGLQAVLEHIPVSEIWWNQTLKESGDAMQLMQQAVNKQIPLYAAAAGISYELEKDVAITFLWPDERSASQHQIALVADQNELSVVLLLQIYDFQFLLTGDINSATEKIILTRMEEGKGQMLGTNYAKPRIDVMKIAHHGSKYSTSSEWLDYWKPISAVVSVSATNSYGHPHPDVLERLQQGRIALWRTDKDGEIMLKATRRQLFILN
ncbi:MULTISPECIES: DNA internalization-related competence protein ComEC/Rec2 [unclassified Paenibacillus]|uniref:DNA internalization-related competence protein ComEC/Rec2 n=1 Tax=unclassified Paenibacillus TaxID=185978 RepID=UPI002F404266